MLCPAEASISISCAQPALLMFVYFKGLVPYLQVFQSNSPLSPLTHQLKNLDSIQDCYLCQLKLQVKERRVIKSQSILFSRQNVLCMQELGIKYYDHCHQLLFMLDIALLTLQCLPSNFCYCAIHSIPSIPF